MGFQDISSHRPMMLKDFLRDDYYQYSSFTSSSNHDLKMYTPRKKPCKSTASVKKSTKQPPAVVLLRSWSRKAAAKKVSAIQKVIKLLQLVKSPSTASSRRNSRKLLVGDKSKDVVGDCESEGEKVKVKVKDILRWRSFRDMVEDESTPLGYSPSPNRTATTGSCSERSSWSGSDFTAEDLPFWGGENEEVLNKKCVLGTIATLLRNTKEGDWSIEECEQQSPVSVLDSPFRQVREPISPFHPTLIANFERAKSTLTRRIQELESITKPKHARTLSFEKEFSISKGIKNAAEEKAKQLLSHVKNDIQNRLADDHIMLDFLTHELSINGKLHDVEFHDEILRFAKSWINGEYDHESYEWEVKDNREAYVKDMEKGVCWNKFKQEQEEVSIALGVRVLDELMDEVLVDLLTK